MQITFDLPHVFNPASKAEENAPALKALLECLININIAFRKRYPSAPSLYRSGVVYNRTLSWDSIPALYHRGYGDCKSLSAALIAEYRIAGVQANPVFRWVKNPNGNTDFHILVQTQNGFEDPSKRLGMGEHENAPPRY